MLHRALTLCVLALCVAAAAVRNRAQPSNRAAPTEGEERKKNNRSSWHRWGKYLYNGLSIIAAIAVGGATVVGAVVAYYAYYQYVQTNSITLRNRLEDTYTEIASVYVDPETQYLSAIYRAPDWEGVNAIEEALSIATEQLKQILDPTKENQIPSDFFSRGINSLSCGLWDDASYDGELWANMRRSYFHVEQYLYLMHSAWEVKEGGIFSHDDFSYWAAFVGEIGTHPMFLAAIHDGHRWGYMKRGFSNWLWEAYRDPEQTRDNISPDEAVLEEQLKAVCALYPALAAERDVWMAKYKEGDEACQSAGAPAPIIGNIAQCDKAFTQPVDPAP